MPLTLITVPCLKDNYAFVLGNPATGEAILIDAPEAEPINTVLAEQGWTLTTVVLTHHHWDHVDGLEGLDGRANLKIVGATADAHRLPPLSISVSDGDTIMLAGEPAHIMDVSGHTVGHIAIYLPKTGVVFTADSLMALGCGRLFEGTAAQMWHSLQKLRGLPPETLVCSGHEYTAANAKFALTIEPQNSALISRAADIAARRAAGQATVPSNLGLECATNPFLRPDQPAIRVNLAMTDATDSEVFAEIRSRKDRF